MSMKLVNVIKGGLAVLPFVVASCMMNDDGDIPDFNEQLQSDIAAIDNYLATNNIDAIEHSSGIRYVIWHDSTGTNSATIDSCVTTNYSGRLMSNGVEFDKGTNISFPLGGVIDGWRIGIPLLTVGDSATLYVPSGFAYGYYGYPPEIPSNANLIFNVAVKNVGQTYKTSDRSCD